MSENTFFQQQLEKLQARRANPEIIREEQIQSGLFWIQASIETAVRRMEENVRIDIDEVIFNKLCSADIDNMVNLAQQDLGIPSGNISREGTVITVNFTV